jgi:exodeoxyribonuclease X
MLRVIVLDTETSGLGADAGVVEIAWTEFDKDMILIGHEYSLIDPQCPINPGASGIHGITNAMVEDAPTLQEFFSVVKGDPFHNEDDSVIVVAHNAAFDLRFVGPFIPSLSGVICTLKCARRVYPDAEDHKLQTLRYALGLDVGAADAHSASGDVAVCVALLKRLMQDTGCDIEGLLELSSMPMKISKFPFGMHKGKKLEELPSSYIHWLLTKATIDDDLRAALLTLKQEN